MVMVQSELHIQILQLSYRVYTNKTALLQTGYLISFKATLFILLLAVILPFVNYILAKLLSLRPLVRDFHVAWFSCLLLLVGNLMIGLAVTDTLMLLGKAIANPSHFPTSVF